MKKKITILFGVLLLSALMSTSCLREMVPFTGHLQGEVRYTGASNMEIDNVIITLRRIDNNIEEGSWRIDRTGAYSFELPAGTYIMELRGNRAKSNELPDTVRITAGQVQTKDINIEQLLSSMVILHNNIEYESGDTITLIGGVALDIWNKYSSNNLRWSIRAFPQPSWIIFEDTVGTVAGGGRLSVVFSLDESMMPSIGVNLSNVILTCRDGAHGSFSVVVQSVNEGGLPIVNTVEVTNITASTATLSGRITNPGIPPYEKKGFLLSRYPTPTTENAILNLPFATMEGDNFIASAIGLELNRTYHVRAFAGNALGVNYSANVIPFTTSPTSPTLITQEPDNISITRRSARFNGTILTAGDPIHSQRGFVFSTNHNPSTENYYRKITMDRGSDRFSYTVTNLTVGTTYYIKAFATYAGGTVYGYEKILKFDAVMPQVTTQAVSRIHETTATFNGAIVSAGDPPYKEKGFVWNTDPGPTVNSSKTVVFGSNNGEFSENITGLTNQTIYYVRTFVTSSTGTTTYGEEVRFRTQNPHHEVLTTAQSTIMVQRTDITEGGLLNWSSANGLCQSSLLGGYTDWRLPTIEELTTLRVERERIGGFIEGGSLTTAYWSSTPSWCNSHYFLMFNSGSRSNDCGDGWGWNNRAHSRCVRTVSTQTTGTVSVGLQDRVLVAGVPDRVSFSITTTNVVDGTFSANVVPLPLGVSVDGGVTINNNVGTLTLSGNEFTNAGTFNTLRLTIDCIQSPMFTLSINPSAAPAVAQVRFRKEINDRHLTEMALDDADNNELAFFVFGEATGESGWFNIPPGNHFPFFLDELYAFDAFGGWRVLLPAPHSHNFVAGRRYTIVLSSYVETYGRIIDEGSIPLSAPMSAPSVISDSPSLERQRTIRTATPANTAIRQRIDSR